MFANIMLILGVVVLFLAFKVGFEEVSLYRRGVKKRAKLIELAPYSYMTITADRNKIYNVGINPIIEIEDDNKRVKAGDEFLDQIKDLKVGDELEVIYPKGYIDKISRYSIYRIFKNSALLGFCSIAIILLAVII